MADEPKIEDPFRRPRPLPQRPPVRRISGVERAAATEPAPPPKPSAARRTADSTAETPIPAPRTNSSAQRPVATADEPVPQRRSAASGARPVGDSRQHRRSSGNSRSQAAPRKTGQAILFASLSAILVLYAFNIANLQLWLETALRGSGDNVSSQPAVWASLLPLVPWVVIVPAVLLFAGVLNSLALMIGLKRRRPPRRKRSGPKQPLERFKRIAATENIRPEFAYRTYTLLQPILGPGETLTPYQDLEDDLLLQPSRVREITLELLRVTDREFSAQDRLPNLRTVLDLMHFAQNLPRRKIVHQEPVFVPGDPGRRR